MNFKHLAALLRLRYQLSRNQVRKAGKLNVVLAMIGLVCAAMCSITAFFVGTIGGAFWFSEASTNVILVTWNIVIALFLLIWLIGLMVELQQTELMSLDKLLHLPISLRGAFFLNYTSSFFNTAFLLFVPAMIGLALGMVLARGFALAMAFPLILGFLFFITTVTYQVRGWLARIMENKRARGTVVAVITIFFVTASQIPNLINMRNKGQTESREIEEKKQLDQLIELAVLEVDAKVAAGQINPVFNGWSLEDSKAELKAQAKFAREARRTDRWMGIINNVRTVDAYFPPGWLPLGVTRAAEGSFLFGLLSTLGMAAMGLVSLSCSYRSSMKRYTGVQKRARRKKQKSKSDGQPTAEFLFKQIPFASEHVSAVAVASFRGLMRAPETKMVLLMPLIFGLLFASFILANNEMNLPSVYRPLVPIGVITVTMFAITSLLFNHFGLDRDGFRALVLSPVDRKDILIGKNISVAPLAFGMCLVLLLVIQFFAPLGPLVFMASVLQIPCVYLLYCVLGNFVSIFFPMGIKRGSMQPANPRFLPMLILMFGMMAGPGILLIPTMAACGIPILLELGLEYSMAWLYLLLTIVQFVATLLAYRWLINHEGNWLWRRESRILDVVANIPE